MIKKFELIILVFFILTPPSVISIYQYEFDQINIKNNTNNPLVFIEYATTTWCPQCPNASSLLYELYNSNQYPLTYVSLVSDVNPNAQIRTKDYKTIAIPTIYINGGNTFFVGNSGTYDMLKDTYEKLIIEQVNTPLNHDITLQSECQWLGDAQIQINITITNSGNRLYYGKIRSYVNEIESRWVDQQGNPYHYALLDFAFNENIYLNKKSSKTLTTIWDGKSNHNGLLYQDITKENIMINTAIFHWVPIPHLGYFKFPYIQFFFSHKVDAIDEVYLKEQAN
jgi:hypothetical protein